MSQINIDFKFDPRIWQKKAFALQKRFTVLAVHRPKFDTSKLKMALGSHL